MDPIDQPADTGTGTEVETDEYAFLDTLDADEQEPTTVDNGDGPPVIQDGDNPKWAPFLEKIPTAFHSLFKEELKARDREVDLAFQERAKQWEPYKKFRDEKIDPEILQKSYDFAQYMAQNPVEIYAQLHESLTNDPRYRPILEQRGLLQAVEAVKADAEENGDPDPFAAEDPMAAVKALQLELKQRDEAMAEVFRNQQFEAQQAQWQREEAQTIENSFANIESRTGPLKPSIKAQIVKEALMMGQTQGRYVPIEEAAVEVFRFMREARPKQSAPRTIPGGGNIPQRQAVDPADMSKEDRVAAVMRIAQQMSDQD